MQTRFHGREQQAQQAHLKFEFVNLTTPEPRQDQGLPNISSPPVINLVTLEPVLVVDLGTVN